MTGLDHYVGQVLDDKYRLERLLGRGGMGAVYLATHLGTERYVALKLISPQFMRNEEFVARFKREARAAGRLRHPNVVDVTDFGFTEAGKDQVAYLVMEYLDGCTLGDVLEEEKRLPVEWVVDIIEQVCSAVHEAHKQGIVHRDLKPDNIWLEPNRLGSYRVKVLDFGIAKLAEVDAADGEGHLEASVSASNALSSAAADTGLGQGGPTQLPSSEAATMIPGQRDAGTVMPGARVTNVTNLMGDARHFELDTVAYAPGEGATGDRFEASAEGDAVETKLFGGSAAAAAMELTRPSQGPAEDQDTDRTLMMDQATRLLGSSGHTTSSSTQGQATKLTRVGAIMGTPVYMSPEQCAAKSLDARSDIYSLGVITYQMLAGEPPFAGNTGSVIREHLELPPPPLREHSKKIPKRVAAVVMSALAKDPAGRPQTALAFADSLRAQATSIGSLYRRAFALYSEYFPKFLKVSVTAHIPFIITTLLLIGLQLAEESQPKGWGATRILIIVATGIVGLTHIVAQFLAAAAISGITAVIVTQLSAAPLRPVELRTPLAVLRRRWKPFLKTCISVTLRILIGFVLLVIPGLIMTVRYALYAPVVLLEGLEKKAAMRRARELASRSWRTVIIVSVLQILIPACIGALIGQVSVGVSTDGSSARPEKKQIYQQLTGLVHILIIPLMSIVPALLYLKMRQLGGESLSALLTKIDEAEERRSHWQQRMRSRATLPTPRSR
ncbi:MAG: serine/threonine protein kinase [Pyrinomonadaceae bacterium]|nr:serine/threonine protein kinase [Pyrinomonadaceae bacterium]